MSFDRKLISKAGRAASLLALVAALHAPAYGGGKVIGPKVDLVVDPAAPPVTIKLVLVQIESIDCCKPCKRRGDPCDQCCPVGARFDATKALSDDDWRPKFDNIPDGIYEATLEVGGKPALYFERPFQVISGKTTKLLGDVKIEVNARVKGAAAAQ